MNLVTVSSSKIARSAKCAKKGAFCAKKGGKRGILVASNCQLSTAFVSVFKQACKI